MVPAKAYVITKRYMGCLLIAALTDSSPAFTMCGVHVMPVSRSCWLGAHQRRCAGLLQMLCPLRAGFPCSPGSSLSARLCVQLPCPGPT